MEQGISRPWGLSNFSFHHCYSCSMPRALTIRRTSNPKTRGHLKVGLVSFCDRSDSERISWNYRIGSCKPDPGGLDRCNRRHSSLIRRYSDIDRYHCSCNSPPSHSIVHMGVWNLRPHKPNLHRNWMKSCPRGGYNKTS